VKKSTWIILIGLGGILLYFWYARQAQAALLPSTATGAPPAEPPLMLPNPSPSSSSTPNVFEAAVAKILSVNPFDMISRGANQTLGERNNNPGNLRFNPAISWLGQTGQNQGFATFDTPLNGIRAMAKNLSAYFSRGLDTVTKIISTWAPPSQNDTASYIAAVSNSLGVNPDDPLNLDDPGTMNALVGAIIAQENGRIIYAQADIAQAVNSAIA